MPKILYDGIQNPAWTDSTGQLKNGYQICIKGNENGSFANIKADKNFKGMVRNTQQVDCSLDK